VDFGSVMLKNSVGHVLEILNTLRQPLQVQLVSPYPSEMASPVGAQEGTKSTHVPFYIPPETREGIKLLPPSCLSPRVAPSSFSSSSISSRKPVLFS
jgi:hypothetical protein